MRSARMGGGRGSNRAGSRSCRLVQGKPRPRKPLETRPPQRPKPRGFGARPRPAIGAPPRQRPKRPSTSGSGTAWPRPRPGPPETARRRVGGPLPAWRARPGAGLWRSPRHLEGLRRAISACSVSRIAQPTTSRVCGARGRPRGGAGPHRSRMSLGSASRARSGRAASKPRPSRPGARAIGRPWRLSGAPAAGRAARPRRPRRAPARRHHPRLSEAPDPPPYRLRTRPRSRLRPAPRRGIVGRWTEEIPCAN